MSKKKDKEKEELLSDVTDPESTGGGIWDSISRCVTVRIHFVMYTCHVHVHTGLVYMNACVVHVVTLYACILCMRIHVHVNSSGA